MVTIGFSQTVFSVPEEDGSGEGYMVEVCLDVFSGQIDRTVIVTMSAADGSYSAATGMFILNTVWCCLFIDMSNNYDYHTSKWSTEWNRPSFRPVKRLGVSGCMSGVDLY